MESIPIYNESVILTSIVNGLIATATLWAFWTPFMIILVVPLMNAMIKQAICHGTAPFNFIALNDINDIINSLGILKSLTREQRGDFLVQFYLMLSQIVSGPSDQAKELIDQDPEEMKQVNKNIYNLMIVSAVFIIVLTLGVAIWMISKYNLNGPRIVTFNVLMALVIVMIEMGFFAGVAAQYVPFDPNVLMSMLGDRIINYAS